MVRTAVRLIHLLLFFTAIAFAQSPKDSLSTTTCTFQSGKQFSVRYDPAPIKKGEQPPVGHEWAPGGEPMYVFTQSPLKIGDVSVPAGAFSLYIVPAKNDGQWSLVVNKGVSQGAKYDKSQDLGRAPLQTGKLPDASSTFTAYLGQMGPDTCTLRLNIGQTRAFADVKEQK